MVHAALRPHLRNWRVVECAGASYSEQLPEDLGLIVAHTPWAANDDVLAWQRASRAAGVPFLPIAFEDGDIVVGPWVSPSAPGCIACRRKRQWAVRSQRRLFDLLHNGPTVSGPPGPVPMLPATLHAAAALAGHAIARHEYGRVTGLEAKTYFVSASNLDARLHAFQPDPTCGQCASREEDTEDASRFALQPRCKPDRRTYRVSSALPTLETLRAEFCDTRLGIVSRVDRQGDVRRMACTWAFVPSPPNESAALGVGRGFDHRQAERVAILEGLERYAGWEPRSRRTVVRGPYDALARHAVDPGLVAQQDFTEASLPSGPLVRYHGGLELNWIWGHSFRCNAPVLVPEVLGFYRLPPAGDRTPHNAFVFETSSGCALGSCYEEAVLHALFELIERDAFLLAWYSRAAVPEVETNSLASPQLRRLIAAMRAEECTVRVFDITTEFGIPVVWALATQQSRGNTITLSSAGAHPDPETALLGALVEIASSLTEVAEAAVLKREAAGRMLASPMAVRTMEDHALLYSTPEAHRRLAFLDTFRASGNGLATGFWARPSILEHDDLADDLRTLVARVLSSCNDVWVVDQTSPELARSGLRAVRAIVPGMLPMTFGHAYRRTTGLARLRDTPRALGWTRTAIDGEIMNDHPHPFP